MRKLKKFQSISIFFIKTAHISAFSTRYCYEDYLLTYLSFLPLVNHRPSTRNLRPTLVWAPLSNCRQMLFILLTSASISWHSMFFGSFLLLFLWGFRVKACLVIRFEDLHSVCPIHLQSIFLIFFLAGGWFSFCHNTLLLMIPG